MKKLLQIFVPLFCLTFLFIGCEKKSPNELKVAATSIPHAEILEHVKPLLKEQGIDLNILIVEDYTIPNRALQDHEVDANYFQHLPFLEAQEADFDYHLEKLAGIHIEPMGLYSKKIKALTDLKAGHTIAIPNDPTNQARALLLLEKKGLIHLRNQGITASVLDIENTPYQFLEIDPALSSRTLDDVDLAAITTNFALQAGLSPQKDALGLEDENSLFTNIVAVRQGEAEQPKLQALKSALTSSSTKRFIEEKYQGAVLPAFEPEDK